MLNSASFPNRYRVPKVSSAREPHATSATARSGREPKPRRRSAAVSEAMSRLSCAPHILSLEHPVLVENRINGRRLGTAQPFPLWRFHSGPQSSSVDQYSETPPEHLASTVTEAMRRSVVTRHCLSKKIGRRNGACAPLGVLLVVAPTVPAGGLMRRWAQEERARSRATSPNR